MCAVRLRFRWPRCAVLCCNRPQMASSLLILAEGRALVNRSAACATPGQYTGMICPDSYGSFRYFARTPRCRVLQDPWPMAIASADWDQHAKSYQTVTPKSLSMASADWSATTASSPATSSDSAVLRVTNACLADRQQTREPYRKTTQPVFVPQIYSYIRASRRWMLQRPLCSKCLVNLCYPANV